MAEPDVGAPIDANGNLTSDGTRTFEWDVRNQLTAVNLGSHRTEFVYDGLRRQVRMVEEDEHTTASDGYFLWCGKRVCEERSDSGTFVVSRKFALGEQIGGLTRFVVADHLGTLREVTGASGALQAQYDTDPWGRRTLVLGSDSLATGYAGHRWHDQSKLSLAPFRAYDADLGRWLSADPLKFQRCSLPDNPWAQIVL